MRYPKITRDLLEQLMRVQPSIDLKMEYRPCKVYLKDGAALDRVYILEKEMYVRAWGVWPGDDIGKRSISIEEILKIEESPLRLPVHIANKIYGAGESGMGYCLFTLVLDDGRKLPYVTGNAVDFVNFPSGVTPAMIRDVHPHEGRGHFQTREFHPETRGAMYYWCLYET